MNGFILQNATGLSCSSYFLLTGLSHLLPQAQGVGAVPSEQRKRQPVEFPEFAKRFAPHRCSEEGKKQDILHLLISVSVPDIPLQNRTSDRREDKGPSCPRPQTRLP